MEKSDFDEITEQTFNNIKKYEFSNEQYITMAKIAKTIGFDKKNLVEKLKLFNK